MSQHQIHLLPEHIIDQIKAGEVIERPANVIKELLENSLDAGSTKVDVHIRENGLELISVEDNGHGIKHNDLPYAFLRHATSKINRFEDIYHLFTYGFRGEALASLSSIGKVQCLSTTEDESSQIIIEGAQVKSHSKLRDNHGHGTSMFIKELFYNTPARLKFVQSAKSEKNRLSKMFKSFLLTSPHIAFSIKWDDEEKKIYPAEENLIPRIKKAFSLKDHIEVLHFEQEYEDYQVSLFFTKESSHGYANKNQFIFINGRYVVDKKIHNIICNCLSSLWPFGEQGHYSIFINLPPEEIDVNVHPNKTMIKFYMPAKVFSLISATIKTGLSTTQIPERQNMPQSHIPQSELPNLDESFDFKDLKERPQEDFQQRVFDHIENTDQGQAPTLYKLSSQFFVYDTDRKYLLDSYKLIHNYLIRSFQKESLEVIPLLISEPFKVDRSSAVDLEDLYKKGFELDALDEKTLVLRTIPSFFNSLPFKQLIENILNSKGKPIESIIQKTDFDGVSPFVINNLVSQIDIGTLLESNIVIPLDNNLLAKLFKGNEK